MEVVTHRADGSEVMYDVPPTLAQTVGYFSLGESVKGFDSGSQKLIRVRPYQLEGVESVQEHRETGSRAKLLHVATGLGKTTMDAMDSMQFELERRQRTRGATRHLFAAHRIELLRQARDTYLEYFPGASVAMLTGDNREDRRRPTAKYTFASLQTLENMRDELSPGWFHRMTVDESHHGPADTFGATIRHFKPESLLGLTGTPFRHDERELSSIFGKTVYSISLARGMAEGWLVNLDYQLQMDRVLELTIGQEFRSVEALNRALFVPRRNGEIARIIRKAQKQKKGPRTIVFCRDIAHAEEMAALLPGAEAIHSDLHSKLKDERIARYRAGRLKTAVTVDIFTEGFDVPETNILAFLRATDRRGIFEQQLGRGMRWTEGKDDLTVLDFVGNSERLFMLHRLLEDIRREYIGYHGGSGGGGNGRQSRDVSAEAERFLKDMGFSFRAKQIAIIERMQQLAEAPTRPKEWQTIGGIADQHGLVHSKISKIIRDLRLEGEIMQSPGGKHQIYYSPQHQIYIDIALKHNKRMEDWPTVAAAADELGMAAGGVRDALKRLNLQARPLRIGSTIQILTPEDFAALAKDQAVGKRAMSVAEIARLANVPVSQANRAVRKLNLVGMLSENRSRTTYEPRDAMRAIRYLKTNATGFLSNHPKSYRSVPDLKTDEAFKGLNYALKALGIEPGIYNNDRGQPTRYLSPGEMKRVKALLKPPPDEYLSYAEVAAAHGVRDTKVASTVKRYGLRTEIYAQRFHKVPRPHLGPKELDQIGRLLKIDGRKDRQRRGVSK